MNSDIRKPIISVIGLGYVGINIAYEFSKKTKVIGFDINRKLINDYKKGIDSTMEIGNDKIRKSDIIFTSNEDQLGESDVFIIAVPTPVDKKNNPDLSALYQATKLIAPNLKEEALVIFESTVSPGTTDRLIKYMEKYTSKSEGIDFYVGYSPERINPGDKDNKIFNSVKIISANDKKTLDKVYKIYSLILKENNIYCVEQIRIAEAAKIVENTQRDVNIAFMNEISRYLSSKSIPIKPVFDAMNTKWNSLKFTPGLVGGHCIGVDPYYLISSTSNPKQLSIIRKSRKENELFAKYIAKKIKKKVDKNRKIGILGFTYKPDVNDIRNTKVFDLIRYLKKYGYDIEVSDCLADGERMYNEYGIENSKELKNKDFIILAVPHKYYLKNLDRISKMFGMNSKKVVFDLCNALDSENCENIIIERI